VAVCIYMLVRASRNFLEEAESLPNSPYSDQVDAASMAFHHLTKPGGYSIEVWERVNA
jgi:phage terminase large subunit-like protein